MATELQPLIEQIQKEAVEKAEQQAAEILAKAKVRADGLVKEAEEKARRRLEQADQDAKAFTERSTRTLEQAARDVLISVQKGVDQILAQVVGEQLDAALQGPGLDTLVGKLIEAYAAQAGAEARLEILISPDDQKRLAALLKNKYRDKLAGGVEIRADAGISRGFQVSFGGGKVFHDFTRDAMAEALTQFLRPHLAGIVQGAAKK
jgi:V/A-type H+-transporting ATPase subunit E